MLSKVEVLRINFYIMNNFENRENRNDDKTNEKKGEEDGKKNGNKTVIFEKKFDVNIKDFSSTGEIDKVVEDGIGGKLGVVKPKGRGIVPDGSAIPIKKYNIDKKFEDTMKFVDKAVKEHEEEDKKNGKGKKGKTTNND